MASASAPGSLSELFATQLHPAAPAGMDALFAPSHEGAARAHMSVQPPECVYQTLMDEGGKQDSSTPLVIEIAIDDAAVYETLRAQVAPVGDGRSTRKVKASVGGAPVELGDVARFVKGTLRRFDGAEVEVYDEAEGCMQGLRLGAACFSFALTSAHAIRIQVHRKYLPVSKCHGCAPFRFAFVIEPPGLEAVVVATTPFMCCSKEPAAPVAPRAPPKRIRNRPSAKPVTAPPSAADHLVNAFFASASCESGSDSGGSSAPRSPTLPVVSPAAAAGIKRGRGDSPVSDVTTAASSSRKRAAPAPPPVPAIEVPDASSARLDLELSPHVRSLYAAAAAAPPAFDLPAPAARASSMRSFSALPDLGGLVGSFPPLRGTSLGLFADTLDAVLPPSVGDFRMSCLPPEFLPCGSPLSMPMPSPTLAAQSAGVC